MTKIVNDVTELIGNTPLVKLNKLTKDEEAKIVGKLCKRPNWSKYDYRSKKKGFLKKDSVIVEPTSGNTGIALAFVCAAKGYRLVLTMPDTMSVERRKILEAFGAEIVLTPGRDGMGGAIKKAEEIVKNNCKVFCFYSS
jgi:cysteine synthase A